MEPETQAFSEKVYPICDNYAYGNVYLRTKTGGDEVWHLEGYFTAISKLAIQGGKLYSKQYINDNGKGAYWHGTLNSASTEQRLTLRGGGGKINHLTRLSADFNLIGAHAYGNLFYPVAALKLSLLITKNFSQYQYTIGEWRNQIGKEGIFPTSEKYPPVENFNINIKDVIALQMSNEEFNNTFASASVRGIQIEVPRINFNQGWDCFGEGNEIYLEFTADNIKVYQPVEHRLSISQAKTDKEKYGPNEEVKVSCEVLDEDGEKVSGADVTAEIVIPDDTPDDPEDNPTETIQLLESVTNAGFYESGEPFTSTSEVGRYTVTFHAEKEGYTKAEPVEISFIVPVQIVMTFDDGPGGYTTLEILDALYANDIQSDIKAAFFVQTHAPEAGGSSIGEALIKKENRDGHIVGVHTGGKGRHEVEQYHWIRAKADKPEDIYDANEDGAIDQLDGKNALECDLVAAKKRIYELTGKTPRFVRPPYYEFEGETPEDTERTLSTYNRQGFKMILTDAKGREGGKSWMSWGWLAVNNLRDTVKDAIEKYNIYKIVVTLHDTNNDVAEYLIYPGMFNSSLLDAIIEGVRKGLNLETIDEALDYTQFISSGEDVRKILEDKTQYVFL